MLAAVLLQSVNAQLSSSQLPPGAYDPIYWAANLRTQKECNISNVPEGLNKTGLPYCSSAQIAINGNTQQPYWTCPAGYFCPGPTEKFQCSPGFYCPSNSIEAVYCPPGFACNNDTTTMEYCPAGKFCPVGTVTPKSCFLANCPLGSSDAPKFLVVLVFAIGNSHFTLVAGAIWFLYKWKDRADGMRERKRKQELESVGVDMAHVDNKTELSKLSRTFDIEFENLGLKLPNGIEIMKGVTGSLRSGRTCAIMGPSGILTFISGAGKTTFVTLLTGKVPRTTGTVHLNGKPDELSNYSKLIGYVPQEDIMIRELTVRDILMHSARMRLPSSWDYPAVKRKVNEIISFLGMKHVAHSIIGNEAERGISGGQRKRYAIINVRVNIGMELVAEPSVLFLDEPTSGLDSSTAFEVCKNLREIAQHQGLTVAAVIHSPSPATFKQFDDFLLLGKGGRVVYMGPRDDAIKWFEFIGFSCPPDESPSDFFMDVASGFIASQYDPAFQPSDLFDYWEQQSNFKYANQPKMTREQAKLAKQEYLRQSKPHLFSEGSFIAPRKFHDYYGFTNYIAVALADIIRSVYSYSKDVIIEFSDFCLTLIYIIIQRPDPIRQRQNVFWQGWFLMKRAYHQTYRTLNATLVDLALNFSAGIQLFTLGLFISIAIQKFSFLGANPTGLCYYAPLNAYYECQRTVDHIREAGMFISLGSLFAGISIAGNTFGYEKVVYWRDAASGMSTIPYYIAKVIVDIPRVIIGAIMFSVALVMFFPYQQSFGSVLSVVIALYFYAFVLGYALSTAVPYSKLAVYGTGVALLWALVLSGVVPDLWDVKTSYPSTLQWIWDISAPRWAIEAFWIKEIQALPFREKNGQADHFYNFDEYNLCFQNITKIIVVWHILGFLGLKLFDRVKQK
ncbi:hypothetical protein HDV06_005506 [Boothiomyces sp. JEL0866]|nr:hypothetical protein HDV06_005506 [Boothiomyces sp. JEL0866]